MNVVYSPLRDNFFAPVEDQIDVALNGAQRTARALDKGQKVLVTCYLGKNRSGLVSALALHLLTGCGGDEAVRTVKKGRPGALENPQFTAYLMALEPRHT